MQTLLNDQVFVFRSSIYCTNTTVVEFDDAVLVCDPTWFPNEISNIRNFIDQRFSGKQLYLFLSHYDYDHVWGWPIFKDAVIIAPNINQYKEIGQKCLNEWHEWDQKHYVIRNYTPKLPDTDIELNEKITFEIGKDTVNFFPVSGHTIDSFAAYIPKYNLLLAGDYLSNVELPWIGTNVDDYIKTLQMFKAVIEGKNINIIIPGHGFPIVNSKEALEIIENGLIYLKHLKIPDEKATAFVSNYLASFPFENSNLEIHLANQNKIKN
jgi:glyoxylase-like metal-dependent hydrolase (beta-lactamase superfamily II)